MLLLLPTEKRRLKTFQFVNSIDRKISLASFEFQNGSIAFLFVHRLHFFSFITFPGNSRRIQIFSDTIFAHEIQRHH